MIYMSRPLQAITSAAVLAMVGAGAPAAPAATMLPGTGPEPTAQTVSARPRHVHHVTRHRVAGERFRCGHLLLTATAGTEVETTDGDRRNGVVRFFLSRVSKGLTLSGSDGRTYRASSVVLQWDVLIPPNVKRPVRGREFIQVVFRGGPAASPGYLHERLVIRDGHKTDTVSGPCDYG
jgi:hypothetical protein